MERWMEIVKTLYRAKDTSTIGRTGWEQGGTVCGLYGIERRRHRRRKKAKREQASKH
jgi:hypothetical protein